MTRDSDKKENEAEVKIEANKEAKLKDERSNLRRLFTVAADSFDDIHRSMNREKNIDIQFSKVYEKAERLFKVDQEIKEIKNFTDDEYDTMESYRDRFTEIRVIYEKNYNKHDESKSEISSNYLKVIGHLKSRFGSKTNRTESHKQVQRDEPTATTLAANTYAGKISCLFCDRPHSSQDCQETSNKSYEDRKSEVIRRRCCLVCLKPGHIAKKCHSNVKSSICERRLHTLLCPYLRKENPSSLKNKGNNAKEKTSWIRSELTTEEIQRAGFDVIDKVQSSESKEKIKWHFSSPSAPWHGGWWERMVRRHQADSTKVPWQSLHDFRSFPDKV
ncbi:transposable element Tc1 transposase [Trichonephila clavata]|uniref:Transposable element Tc1 transposase n=1 Tax=Trichonephila clavata TaxID=2740835 RepID=A0A8X6GCA5_TRICU|nr:transposable element Tc1 transposase [Trichonephila clavata]